MGTNPLDADDKFWEDMEDVVLINIKRDKTINIMTSVKDMTELKSVFSTAFTMAMFQDMKSNPTDIDKMH